MKSHVRTTQAVLAEDPRRSGDDSQQIPPPEAPLSARGVTLQEPSLQEDRHRLRAILREAVEGIIIIDGHGTIETFNPAAERMFGYSAQEIIGQKINFLMPSPYREEHDYYLQNYLATGHAKIIGIGREVVGMRKDGSLFPMDLSVCEVHLETKRLFAGFVRDISERKQANERLQQMARNLAEKNKELETLLYVASHDLRSPLVNIQGFSKELTEICSQLRSRMLPSGPLPKNAADWESLLHDDIPEALHYIQAGVAKIDALLAGLLRFSRLGQAALSIQRLDMNGLASSIVQAMEFQIQQADVKLQIDPLPDAVGDPTQINQVFSNLLDNALKYRHPERQARIRIRGSEEGSRSVYAVEDNGIGMAANNLQKIFEMFYRLDPSHGPGEGLGLTIARRILQRQEGTIWVESLPDRGTTFYVSLPKPTASEEILGT